MLSPALAPVTPDRPRRRGERRSSARVAQDMLERYADALGLTLRSTSVTLPSGARVLIDGATADGSLFVEAHGPTTPLRQIDLVLIAQDVFKLALVRSSHPDARAVVLVPDEHVRDTVRSSIERTPAAGVVEITVCP